MCEPLYCGCKFRMVTPGTAEHKFMDKVILVTHLASEEEIMVSGRGTSKYRVAQLLELNHRIISLIKE